MCTKCPIRKRIVLIIAIIITFFSVLTILLSDSDEQGVQSSTKPVISVSTYTLYEAAHAIAADTLDIRSIIPLGSDAHMFSPNPMQVAEISRSALFVYNGAGFETWAESLKPTLPKSTHVIDMSTYVALLKTKEGAPDPHYWLDIDNMIRMTQTLEAEFIRLSPANEPLYIKNATAYIAMLQKLKTDYAAELKTCHNRTLVSNHNAFGYLAHANHFDNISIIGLSSDAQPSAQIIARVISLVKEHAIKTIFFEELINDNVAQTIAKESGAHAESLQPLENISEDELKSHQTYESIMRHNLAKLTQAMECR
jgi:zinc transport system substrate-binding protein